MDKYKLILLINILQVIGILGIIILAGIFNNWWLLFLILALGYNEDRILNYNDKNKRRKVRNR